MGYLEIPVTFDIDNSTSVISIEDIEIDSCDTIIDFDVVINTDDIEIDFELEEGNIVADFGTLTERIIHGEENIYQGEYEVTPKVTEQSLATKQKFMEKDVTIHQIPTFEVSNENGTTFYIGEKVNGL